MPPTRTQERRPRQDPVSCQLCRTKKLKCDRQKPCSNCSARRLSCQYHGETPSSHAADTPAPLGDESLDSLRAENRTIKARLQKLEQTVFGESVTGTTRDHASVSTAASTPHSQQLRPRTEGDKADEDSQWLETIGARSEVVLPEFSDPCLVNLLTMEEFMIPDQRPPQLRRIDLPTHDVAVTALNAYAEHLDAVQHIMHVESTRKTIDEVYNQIHAGVRPDPGALALILALCSNIGFYSTVGLHRGTNLFPDGATATAVSMQWAKQALYAIEQARIATTTTTLASIQGSIMVLFLLYHMEGFTFRVRVMHMTAIAMARDMGLHNVDAPREKPADYTQSAIIDLEVRRKIWWHLSCTDWLMSFLGGPWEGMYSIHASQMQCQLPRNLTRDDLNTQGPDFSRSISEPTVMSYYLQRVKMAVTCREIADALWAVADPETVDYAIVKSLDARFETQIQEFPRFLRVDIPSKQLRAEYGDAYDQQVDIQGVMVNLMINTRRCKLHLPFLIRAKQNTRFAYSRRMGLQAARAVFRVRRFAMEDKSSMAATHLKLGGMLQHLFFATVALVMDVCVNRDESDPSQMAEVREALSIMQESKDSSGRGAKFFDSLVAVLRKHHVKLPNPEKQQSVAQLRFARSNQDMIGGADNQLPVPDPHMIVPYAGMSDSAFNLYATDNMPAVYPPIAGSVEPSSEIFQDFMDQGMTLEPQDWEQIFTDLDMRMM